MSEIADRLDPLCAAARLRDNESGLRCYTRYNATYRHRRATYLECIIRPEMRLRVGFCGFRGQKNLQLGGDTRRGSGEGDLEATRARPNHFHPMKFRSFS